jgi:hypothetical protein
LSVLKPQSTGATAVPAIPPRNTVSDPFASSPFTPSEYLVLVIALGLKIFSCEQ